MPCHITWTWAKRDLGFQGSGVDGGRKGGGRARAEGERKFPVGSAACEGVWLAENRGVAATNRSREREKEKNVEGGRGLRRV